MAKIRAGQAVPGRRYCTPTGSEVTVVGSPEGSDQVTLRSNAGVESNVPPTFPLEPVPTDLLKQLLGMKVAEAKLRLPDLDPEELDQWEASVGTMASKMAAEEERERRAANAPRPEPTNAPTGVCPECNLRQPLMIRDGQRLLQVHARGDGDGWCAGSGVALKSDGSPVETTPTVSDVPYVVIGFNAPEGGSPRMVAAHLATKVEPDGSMLAATWVEDGEARTERFNASTGLMVGGKSMSRRLLEKSKALQLGGAKLQAMLDAGATAGDAPAPEPAPEPAPKPAPTPDPTPAEEPVVSTEPEPAEDPKPATASDAPAPPDERALALLEGRNTTAERLEAVEGLGDRALVSAILEADLDPDLQRDVRRYLESVVDWLGRADEAASGGDAATLVRLTQDKRCQKYPGVMARIATHIARLRGEGVKIPEAKATTGAASKVDRVVDDVLAHLAERPPIEGWTDHHTREVAQCLATQRIAREALPKIESAEVIRVALAMEAKGKSRQVLTQLLERRLEELEPAAEEPAEVEEAPVEEEAPAPAPAPVEEAADAVEAAVVKPDGTLDVEVGGDLAAAAGGADGGMEVPPATDVERLALFLGTLDARAGDTIDPEQVRKDAEALEPWVFGEGLEGNLADLVHRLRADGPVDPADLEDLSEAIARFVPDDRLEPIGQAVNIVLSEARALAAAEDGSQQVWWFDGCYGANVPAVVAGGVSLEAAAQRFAMLVGTDRLGFDPDFLTAVFAVKRGRDGRAERGAPIPVEVGIFPDGKVEARSIPEQPAPPKKAAEAAPRKAPASDAPMALQVRDLYLHQLPDGQLQVWGAPKALLGAPTPVLVCAQGDPRFDAVLTKVLRHCLEQGLDPLDVDDQRARKAQDGLRAFADVIPHLNSIPGLQATFTFSIGGKAE